MDSEERKRRRRAGMQKPGTRSSIPGQRSSRSGSSGSSSHSRPPGAPGGGSSRRSGSGASSSSRKHKPTRAPRTIRGVGGGSSKASSSSSRSRSRSRPPHGQPGRSPSVGGKPVDPLRPKTRSAHGSSRKGGLSPVKSRTVRKRATRKEDDSKTDSKTPIASKRRGKDPLKIDFDNLPFGYLDQMKAQAAEGSTEGAKLAPSTISKRSSKRAKHRSDLAVLIVTAVLSVIVVGAVGTFSYIQWVKDVREEVENSSERQPYRELIRAVSLKNPEEALEVKKQILRDGGGQRPLAELKTMSATGIMETDFGNRLFSLNKLQGDYFRLDLETKSGRTVYSIGPEAPWSAIYNGDQLVRAEDYSGHPDNVIYHLHDFHLSQFENVIRDARFAKATELVGESTFRGQECYLLQVTTEEGATIQAYFDKFTRNLISEIVTSETGQSQRIFSEFRLVDGFSFPFRIDYFNDGSLLGVINLDRIIPNVGLIPEQFNAPVDSQ